MQAQGTRAGATGAAGGIGRGIARRARLRGRLIAWLTAFLCLSLAATAEAPAQTAPWDIEGVQNRLVELGYDVGEVDGLLGPKTRAALRAFQQNRGLSVTGLPDGATQRALFADETPEAPGSEPATAEPARPEPETAEPAVPESSVPESPVPESSVPESSVPVPTVPVPTAPAPTTAEAPKAAPQADDPPSLDAVPLEPVRVEPLAPIESAPSASLGPAEPAGSLGRTIAAADGGSPNDARRWTLWLRWTAVGLAAVGALVWAVALALKAARRRSRGVAAVAAAPGKAGSAQGQVAQRRAAVGKTQVRHGHVFGIDIPSLERREPG
jgi:peptidoglycan hydrolase-like protein with peptidoglycan-binding domain